MKIEKEYFPLPKPYKTGTELGMPIVKVLLRPEIKELVDKMRLFKGSYIGVAENEASFFINDNPVFNINRFYVEDIKTVFADDVKEYDYITEYRLSEDRFKQIMIYYQK